MALADKIDNGHPVDVGHPQIRDHNRIILFGKKPDTHLTAYGYINLDAVFAQDVFYQVWENAATYRPDQAKLTTWMTSITRYRAIDVLRKRRSRPEKDSVEWAETALHTTPRPEEGPEELADLLLQQERVRLAVNSLSSDQQAVLALAYFQGLSHSQIAGQLNQPLGTVKTRIRLAMQRLRELLIEEP